MSSRAVDLRRMPVRFFISAIQTYRHMVSPLRPPTCRFMPTCSQYAVEALTEYGVFRGGWLAIVRLGKCGPWHRGGWDPIPERATDHPRHLGHYSQSHDTDAADGRNESHV
jgi:uncharacterized protein